MSNKGNKSAGSAKGKKPAKSGAESKGEDVLQAVILADSFQDRFKPFTLHQPRCLLPLANTPLIEYTLEFLEMNGVNQVYIYCGAHTDMVEEHINRSRWSTVSKLSPFSLVQFIRVADARSVGDVLRDLDTRSLIDGDFILVHGDLLSNVKLDGILADHRKRREENAQNIMTCILRNAGHKPHRTKNKGIMPIYVIDNDTQRCLHYDEMSPISTDRYTRIDSSILKLTTDFDIRTDLIDPQIDICTPEVLALWSESFDYELPRSNFLRGVLKDWELNGKIIHTYVVDDDGYAARAHNWQMYDAISRDVLGRWTFPLLPENNLSLTSAYQTHPRKVVIEESASYASGSRLQNSVIGANTTIGTGTTVTNCFIGHDCIIGAGVSLTDSYIWNQVTIEDNATVTYAVLADGTKIGKGATVSSGCLLSFGVHIGENVALEENTVISVLLPTGQPAVSDAALVGASGIGAAFRNPDLDELEERDPVRLEQSLIYSMAGFNVSNPSISTLNSDGYASDSDSDEPALGDVSDKGKAGTGAAGAAAGAAGAAGAADKHVFHADAVHGLVDALRADSGDFDSAKLEFMGLRLANNASDEMMGRAVATAFARRAAELVTGYEDNAPLEPTKAAEAVLTASRGAVRFISEVGVGSGTDAEQVAFILALQKALSELVAGTEVDVRVHVDVVRAGTVLVALMQQLYALDVLEEDGILAWWEDERAVDGEDMVAIKEKCRVLVEWLENAEEEDEDSEED